MSKLLVCIDGSVYADNICLHAAWAAKNLDAEVDLLHVLRRSSEYQGATEHIGSIGLGARSGLLERLTQVDEERGLLDNKKGDIILEHGAGVLKKAGVKRVNIIKRRGALVDVIQELESGADIIFMGKRGEHANLDSAFLGANLEKSARAVSKPMFVTSSVIRPISRFLIAYDGKDSVNQAINYVVNSPLLKGVECHLLAVSSTKENVDLSGVEKKLQNAKFDVITKVEQNSDVDEAISSYVVENNINLLVTGAYSHSRIRNLLLGSTTASLIKSCKIPLLLFR